MEGIERELRALEKVFDALPTAGQEDAEVYDCARCRDVGYFIRRGRAFPCPCRLEERLIQAKIKAGLNRRLQGMIFDNFDLDYYPDDLLDADGDSYLSLAKSAKEDAVAFARKCAADQGPLGLLIQGEVGCGKTHLAAAIANELVERGVDVMFIVVPELLDQLRASYRRENEGLDETEIIKRAYSVPVLILDDMGAHNFTEWVRNKLFAIINYRYNSDLPCVITTNLSLGEMNKKDIIGDRTTSRILEMCVLRRLMIDRDARRQQSLKGRRV